MISKEIAGFHRRFFVWVFLFHILASASTVLIQIPSAWASGARWCREQEAQPIICPVGIPQGLWVWLLRPSLPLPSRVVQWIQSMCTPQLLQTGSVGFMQHWNVERAAWWWARHTHCRWDSSGAAIGQCYSCNLKALPSPQTLFFCLAHMKRRQFWSYIWISGTSQNVARAPGPAPFSSSTDSLFSWKLGLYLLWEGSPGDRRNNICELVCPSDVECLPWSS